MSDLNNETSKAIVIKAGSRGLVLGGLEEMWRFAVIVRASGLAPNGFTRAEQILLAVQGGAELGMSPMQALQNLTVVNGKIGMYAATARAMVEAHPECEWVRDDQQKLAGIQEFKDEHGVTVKCKRHGRPPVTRRFTVADAKRAGLWEKGSERGPSAWITYPARMLYARALGFALHDCFGDVLRGLKTAEELGDYPAEGDNFRVALRSGDTLPAMDLDAVAKKLDDDGSTAETISAEHSHSRGFSGVIGADILDAEIERENGSD